MLLCVPVLLCVPLKRDLFAANMPHKVPSLVSVGWLSAQLKAPNLKLIDASWYLPAMKRSGFKEYNARRIPGALFFDVSMAGHAVRP